MKRIFGWLETKLSRQKSATASDAASDSESAKPDEFDLGIDLLTASQELAKNVLMPDIHSDEHVPTVPNLEILDESPGGTDKSTGFNPYDTAVLKKK